MITYIKVLADEVKFVVGQMWSLIRSCSKEAGFASHEPAEPEARRRSFMPAFWVDMDELQRLGAMLLAVVALGLIVVMWAMDATDVASPWVQITSSRAE